MGPVKLLFFSHNASREMSFSPSSAGMRPPSLLLCNPIMIMLTQELRFAGNVPEKELSFKSSLCRRRRRPRLAGISPWSQFKLRFNVRRNVRFPRAGESGPVSPLPPKLSSTTRTGLRCLHVTPSQLQKSVLLFQESSKPPSLTCALKASNVASSPAITMVTAGTAASEHSKRQQQWVYGRLEVMLPGRFAVTL